MLILKALHIFFVISWFAGLFYLPRIFVNLAMTPPESAAERERLLLMAGKLYRFMTPLGILALALGLWSGIVFWGFSGGWIHTKTLLAAFLAAYHLYCGRLLRAFAAGGNRHGHVWFRWFNEIPVLVLLMAVFLAVLKPF
ncbi:MAG: CopD family protein [Betaproteobacteria bacterium]|nr:CopD family protein [Betaproteobacteria bacterium]